MSELMILRSAGGRVGEIVLNRPDKSNALTPGAAASITAALIEFDADPLVCAVVLRATGGRSFCGGYDLGGVARGVRDQELQRMLRVLRGLSVLSIAVVDGHAVGAGLDLACSCDVRIVRRGVRIGLPAVRLGVAYDAEGLWRILAVAPGMRVQLLTGALREAEAVAGFADLLGDDGELEAQLTETLAAVTSASPAALAYMVAMIRPGASQSVDVSSARVWRDAVLDGPDVETAARARTEGTVPAFAPRTVAETQ
jgi:enoyl-CoA hydratase